MKYISYNRFGGGIAESPFEGIKGSFAFGQNLNVNNRDQVLTCSQKMKLDKVLDARVVAFVNANNGRLYAFLSNGKVWSKDSLNGTWTQHTSLETGLSACQFNSKDGSVYSDYLYWATPTKIRKLKIDNSNPAYGWGSLEADVHIFKNPNIDHPMIESQGVLLVGDGEYLVMIDRENAVNGEALDIVPGNSIKSLSKLDNRVLIGTEKKSNEQISELFTWDKLQDSWIERTIVPENKVNNILVNGSIFVQAGSTSKLYVWDLRNIYPLKEFYGTGNYILPNASIQYKGLSYLGVSGNKTGIYSYGQYSYNTNRALNLEYTLSHGNDIGVIGAIANYYGQLFVGWESNGTYGIDTIDTANKANGIWESVIVGREVSSLLALDRVIVKTNKLPAGVSLTVKARENLADSWTTLYSQNKETQNDTGMKKFVYRSKLNNLSQIQLRIELNSYQNVSPEVLAVVLGLEAVDEIR